MAAEVQEWVEGGEIGKKLGCQQEPLVVVPVPSSSSESGGSNEKNGSVGTDEPALSVSLEQLSEEYSSDSGKGGSDTTVTPPDSINGCTDPLLAGGVVEGLPWNLCHGYTTYTAYSKSLGSVMPNHAMIYEFEIPQASVGRLIGRFGSYVNKIKYATGANIIVKRHQQTKTTKICAVEGICSEIDQAIEMIRDRFPAKRYPQLTLEQVNLQQVIPASNISFIPNNRLNLIEGIVNDVTVSCVVDLDHIFIQQPTHPSYPALARLHDALKGLYEQPKGGPQLVRPFNPGVICITKIGGDDWVRAEVVAFDEETDQATAKLVDVGGYVQVPFEVLRQIRVDFVTIPFQATECRLANVAPIDEKEGWSQEAVNFFKIVCQGQVLQAHVVGYCNLTGSTLINLYKPVAGNSSHILVNEEMVTHNYAKWIDEIDQQYYYADSVAAYSGEIDQLSQNLGEWVTLSPDLMTVVQTEQNNYNANVTEDNAATSTATATVVTDTVPETDETQKSAEAVEPSASSSSAANDNSCNVTSSIITAAKTCTLTWSAEMSDEELVALEELTEDKTTTKQQEFETSRRKKKNSKSKKL